MLLSVSVVSSEITNIYDGMVPTLRLKPEPKPKNNETQEEIHDTASVVSFADDLTRRTCGKRPIKY